MQLTRRGAARLAPLAVLSALALAGCNHPAATDTSGSGTVVTTPGAAPGAVATVTTPKGTVLSLTQPEFYAQLQNYVPNSPPSPTSPQGAYAPPGQPAGRLVLQQLLMSLMLQGLAQDQGVAPTDAEINTRYDNVKMIQDSQNVKGFEQALTDAGMTPDVFKDLQVKPQLAQLNLLTKGVTVTDADIQAYYDAHKDKQFTKPARVHIKKIAVATLADAQAISAAIKGGQTFESQLPKSVDKTTPDGEVPNWVPIDPVPPAQAAIIKPIIATPPGQVTPPLPVPGPNGQSTYWIVKVVETAKKETLPLDKVKDLIRANLLQQKAEADPNAQQAVRQQIHDFQSAAKVSIAGAQYAALAQELTHPAPLAAPGPMGASPFAPAPGGKP